MKRTAALALAVLALSAGAAFAAAPAVAGAVEACCNLAMACCS